MFDTVETVAKPHGNKTGTPSLRAKLATVEARIATLTDRHASLDAAIAEEMTNVLPDDMKLRRLKRAKLRLKDDIAFLAGLTRTLSRGFRPAATAA